MDKLYKIAEMHKLHIKYTNLLDKTNGRLYGLYIYSENGCGTLLDKSLLKPENYRLHRCVLAEEAGHHIKTTKSNVLRMSGSCRLEVLKKPLTIIAQDEIKALKWACSFLIPNVEFYRALSEGYTDVYNLSDIFNVTEWMVYRKFSFMK